MRKLENKVTVITGGNSGIGLGMARKFKSEGARIAIFGRSEETLEAAKQELGGDTIAVKGDIRNVSDIERLYKEVENAFGRVDVVVANAGGASFGPFTETDEEAFDRQVDINFKGAFFTAQKALPLFGENGGNIILVSSISAHGGYAGMAAYASAKGAVNTLVRSLATELAPSKIRVNGISPGHTDTPAFDRVGLPVEMISGMKQHVAQNVIPFGRMGTPEDLANGALFLASDDAAYVTGIDLIIDGGANVHVIPQPQPQEAELETA